MNHLSNERIDINISNFIQLDENLILAKDMLIGLKITKHWMNNKIEGNYSKDSIVRIWRELFYSSSQIYPYHNIVLSEPMVMRDIFYLMLVLSHFSIIQKKNV